MTGKKIAVEGFFVKREVAEDESTPPETLELLARDVSARIRGIVALNPNAPPESLTVLAVDDDEDVREFVGLHPKTPVESLARLLFDPNQFVRDSTAQNPGLITALSGEPFEVSAEFLEQTPVTVIFNNLLAGEALLTADILLCAARDDVCLSLDSFEEAFKAVTDNGIYPSFAVNISGAPMRFL